MAYVLMHIQGTPENMQQNPVNGNVVEEVQNFFEQKLDYLHDNPVRAGYVTDPCDWKYSSAGFYHKEVPSVVPIAPMEW